MPPECIGKDVCATLMYFCLIFSPNFGDGLYKGKIFIDYFNIQPLMSESFLRNKLAYDIKKYFFNNFSTKLC